MKQAKSLTLFLTLSVFLAACGGEDNPDTAAGTAGEIPGPSGEPIIVSLPADVTRLDPPTVSNAESLLVIKHLYDRLTDFADSTEVEVIPGLAERWDVSEDGLSYTFHLRDDAFFSNGDPVTAQDVQFSLQRIYDADHPAHWNITWKDDVLGPWFDRFEIIDDKTITLHLKEPYVALLANLAMPCSSIVNDDHVMAMGREEAVNVPMGSGPYTLDDWQRGSFLRLAARDEHWRNVPPTPVLIFRTQKEMNQRMAALERGDVHMTYPLSPAVVGDESRLTDVTIIRSPMLALHYAVINTEKFPSREFRQGLNYAVNREALCEGVLQGTGTPAGAILPPGMLGYREDRPFEYSYDPEKARELIEASGMAGETVTLMCFPEARPYNIAGTRAAQRIQEDLRNVGLEVELEQRDFGGFLEILSQRTYHELATVGWMSDTGDPDNFIYVLFGTPTNRSNYVNEEANRLMAEARTVSDLERRAELYAAAEDAMLEDPPAIFLNYASRTSGVSNRLKGFNPHVWKLPSFWDAYLE